MKVFILEVAETLGAQEEVPPIERPSLTTGDFSGRSFCCASWQSQSAPENLDCRGGLAVAMLRCSWMQWRWRSVIDCPSAGALWFC